MYLRFARRRKDGKEHRYWSIVENRRVGGGRVVQRPLLYLGEINDSQELAWRKSIAVLEEGAAAPRPLSLFPEDRCEGVLPDAAVVRLKLAELRLRRPRQWGGCWLAVNLCTAFIASRVIGQFEGTIEKVVAVSDGNGGARETAQSVEREGRPASGVYRPRGCANRHRRRHAAA